MAKVLLARSLRLLMQIIYAPLKLRRTRRKVVMLSRQSDTAPVDFVLLRQAIERADPSVEIVVLARMIHDGLWSKVTYAWHLVVQMHHISTARVLVLDTYSIAASLLNHKRSLTVIQIWHAVSAFKKFGLSILDQPEGRDGQLAKVMRMHAGYDLVLAGGEAARAPFAEAFGAPLEKIVVAPLPRVDLLLDPAEAARARARIFAEYQHLEGKRIALYAPTYRMHGDDFVVADVDTASLTQQLSAVGFQTVVKLHPHTQVDLGPSVECAPAVSTQDLLHIADLFITDYSSTIFEAAVLGIPSCFLAPDLDEYLAARDFYLDYHRDLPGPLTGSVSELVAAVTRGEATEAKVAEFAKQWIQVPDAASSSPCADHLANVVLSRLSLRSDKIGS